MNYLGDPASQILGLIAPRQQGQAKNYQNQAVVSRQIGLYNALMGIGHLPPPKTGWALVEEIDKRLLERMSRFDDPVSDSERRIALAELRA